MADYKINDSVLVRQRHLHGNFAELKPAQVVSVKGDSVRVNILSENAVKDFPKDQVEPASVLFGVGQNLNNPYELPIKKMYR